jgi:D-amino-acid dehydrogenase
MRRYTLKRRRRDSKVSQRRTDVIVLGAGAVGVATALHLQARGRDVVIVDRHEVPAGETSYGNAGIVEGSAFEPPTFPRDLAALALYARNATSEANYHPSALPRLAPWLWAYFRESAPDRAARATRALTPLVKAAVAEHDALAAQAGAERLIRRTGWIKLYRTPESWAAIQPWVGRARDVGMTIDSLDQAALAKLEPHVTAKIVGGLLLHDAITVRDPGDLTQSYFDLFRARGGRMERGDARSLQQSGADWTVSTQDGPLTAREVVTALGPWSDDVFRPLGYRIPLGVKRGYHLHFAARGNAALERPIYDAVGGYVLAPMQRGVRLTTGVEFAERDAPPSPVQIEKTRGVAASIFPLGDQAEPTPWMGRRPCLPDMVPVIGPAPRHRGLWFNFGHQHLGLTLGPVSGRLLAQMMTGETPTLDPALYAATRFG